jgi:hypothetical protein
MQELQCLQNIFGFFIAPHVPTLYAANIFHLIPVEGSKQQLRFCLRVC